MERNPSVVRFDEGYVIRFTRRSWTVLNWVQDMSGRKMKNLERVSLPLVSFPSREDAELEVRSIVIPYLLENKSVDADDIVGWS